MLRKIAAALLCALFIACFILAGFSAIYFILPSRKAQASIELAESVSDPSTEEVVETAEEETENLEDSKIYVADVENVLHLRKTPNTKDEKDARDLVPLTHLKMLEDNVTGNDGHIFARVEVITYGEHQGQRGYVLRDYIVKEDEPTKRARRTQ